MKKYLTAIVAVIMSVFLTFAATACGNESAGSADSASFVTPIEGVDVKAKKTEANIALEDLDSFNYASLFEIYLNGDKIAIKNDYIDKSAIVKEVGAKFDVYCNYGGQSAKVTITVVNERNVFVQALKTKVTVKDVDIYTYDYASLFSVSVNGNETEVKPEYLDLSGLKTEPGTYVVTCSYAGSSAKVWIEVTETPFVATALESDVYVNKDCVNDLKLTELFAITLNGEEIAVTEDMISGEVGSSVGDYEITLVIGSRSVQTTVHVVDRHIIKIGSAYAELDLTPEELSFYDFAADFYIYEDGKTVSVNSDGVTLDKSAIFGATVGGSYNVTLTYASEDGKGSATATVKVNVVEVGSVVIKVKNTEVFESDYVDLTQIFEITRNGAPVTVTSDMISGEVNFEDSDECEITLKYDNRVKVATLKKITGVSIKYAHGDVVTVAKGTNKDEYYFAGDFEVYINGLRFYGIEGWIDTTNVDFGNVGSYEAALTVKYNDASIGLGKPGFAATKTKTITYKVEPSVYELTYGSETVELEQGTTEYNPLSNLTLTVNGYKQSFTQNRNSVNSITTYYEVVSAPDLTKAGEQTIKINLYVHGLDYAPVTATYKLVVKSGIVVYAEDRAVFTGETLYTPDLFKVFEDGKAVNVTLEMVSGRIDTETAGIYELTVSYKGVVRTASVSVIPSGYVGVYETADKTISKQAVEGEDGDVAEDEKPSVAIGDMVIGRDMSIDVHGIKAENIKLTDYGFKFSLKNNNHEVYFNDGIAVLVPLNEIKLEYNDDKRPIVYFHKDVWTIADSITLNSAKDGSSVYGDAKYSNRYSIYLYKIKNNQSGETKWFAIKIKIEKSSSYDTVYSVVFDYVEVSSGISSTKLGATGTIALDDEFYPFTISGKGVGSINTDNTNNPFANKTFTGMFDGKSATLTLGVNECPELIVGGSVVFRMNRNEFAPKYKASSAADGTINVYGFKVVTLNKRNNTTSTEYKTDLSVTEKDDENEKTTLTLFSYMFLLDTETNTFDVIERDEHFGLYKNAEGRYIFLDGFGRGIIDFTGERTDIYSFYYSVNGNMLVLDYNDDAGDLSSEQAIFSIDGFGNVLTVQNAGDEFVYGETFENEYISHGAVVTLDKTVFHKGDSKDEIINAVRIVTTAGEYTLAQKKSDKVSVNGKQTAIVDTSRISMNYPGFYCLAIHLKVGENNSVVTKYFAVQILEETFVGGSGFARNYGASLSGVTSFNMNAYGEITFVHDGATYTGFGHESEGKLFATVHSGKLEALTLRGELNADGILTITAVNKNVLVTEYYSAGTVAYAGNGIFVVRSFATPSGNVFYVSSALSVLGDKVDLKTVDGEKVTSLSVGTILSLTYGGENYVLRISELGNEKTGLEISDLLGGTYVSNDETETLVLDGYGSATLNGTKGTYTVYSDVDGGKRLVVKVGGKTIRAIIGISGERAGLLVNYGEVKASNLDGKSYTADISDDYEVSSMATLVFGANGSVTVGFECSDTSASNPSYVGNGTFTVSGETITIYVNGYVITLGFTDPWQLVELRVKNISRPEGYDEPNGDLRAGRVFK